MYEGIEVCTLLHVHMCGYVLHHLLVFQYVLGL